MGTATFMASEPVYVSSEGRMVYAGEKFTVPDDVPAGESWLGEDGKPLPERKKRTKRGASKPEQVDLSKMSDDELKAEFEKRGLKSDEGQGGDSKPTDYSKMSDDELKAEAGKRKIAIEGLTKAKIVEALRASDAEG